MRGSGRRLRFLFLPLCLAACGSQTSAGDVLGKIAGHVSLSPVTPLCRADEPCDGAYADAPIVARDESGDVVVRTTTDKRGDFVLNAPAGSYAVGVEVTGRFPRCGEAHVVVAAMATARADLDCDTGMR